MVLICVSISSSDLCASVSSGLSLAVSVACEVNWEALEDRRGTQAEKVAREEGESVAVVEGADIFFESNALLELW